MTIVIRFLWAVSAIAAIVGAVAEYIVIEVASGAPQEASGSAMVLVGVIVPYVLARSVSEMVRK